jgi:nicotinamide-nucleotide amidase
MDLSGAEIIVIGNEILSGKRIDTNSAFLGRTLGTLGITVTRKVTVRDTRAEIVDEVQKALERSVLIVTSGGLGPTVDDVTRESLAEACGISLRLDEEYLGEVRDMFQKRGLAFSENNRQLAMVPYRGCFFRNPHGSAPGLCFHGDRFLLVALPGPPRELEPMVKDSLIPHLRSLDPSLREFRQRSFRLVGLGESSIDQEVRQMISSADPLEISSIPHLGWVEVTFGLLDDSPAGLARFQELCMEFSRRFEREIFGGREDTLESSVGELLRSRGETLATAESWTGGLLGGRITATAGSSDYYRGGLVAYSNDVKEKNLKVSQQTLLEQGAVSEAAAAEMAKGVRQVLGSDWGISCTGIAGPGGGTQEKPVGLVYIGISGPTAGEVECHQFLGSREAVRERTVVAALNLLRRFLARQA